MCVIFDSPRSSRLDDDCQILRCVDAQAVDGEPHVSTPGRHVDLAGDDRRQPHAQQLTGVARRRVVGPRRACWEAPVASVIRRFRPDEDAAAEVERP